MKKKNARVGKKIDLKIKKNKDYGCLSWAVIGDFKGKGKQRVILHEVTIDWKNECFSYGNKRIWNFPVK